MRCAFFLSESYNRFGFQLQRYIAAYAVVLQNADAKVEEIAGKFRSQSAKILRFLTFSAKIILRLVQYPAKNQDF